MAKYPKICKKRLPGKKLAEVHWTDLQRHVLMNFLKISLEFRKGD